MIIDGYDYHFLYSVGAFLGIRAAKFGGNSKDPVDRIKTIIGMAVLMSKEYEDSQKLQNPEYETHYLRPERLRALTMREFDQLMAEVDDAVAAGQVREVEAEEIKKKDSATERK